MREGPYGPEKHPTAEFMAYREIEVIPPPVAAAIVERESEAHFAQDLAEVQDGSVLWVATVNGAVAGVRHSRRGKQFRHWFVPIRENDMVIFRGRTYPEFRGQGISPSMHRHIMHSELAPEDRVYADCALYNKPSRRSLQKAGYHPIATMKPITREWALYDQTGPI
ncbi:GNAT family protein [Thioalkalivibrio sp. XN8]|uniref:GNAT family N-acetyltransferase n=1 Tax=Thioalkalivibrio sp. XN8 TaxID=2712863 RepID=UPI0013EA7B8A|nr:GNAT family protein [Thioalkalivibrio sp. XN8]NGP53696.1 GNAT family N-acetyltransferase [Thioalkalivibrio sp. XN8]